MIIKILSVKTAEELFGPLTSKSVLTALYHSYVKEVHPDYNSHKDASDATARLTKIYDFAVTLLNSGNYGKNQPIDPKPAVSLTVGKSSYVLGDKKSGDICDVFEAGEYVVKIPRDCKDNDLMAAEATALKDIWEVNDDDLAPKFLPKLIGSHEIKFKGNRRVNILSNCGGVTLEEVIKAYPDGVDLRSAAWMFNRVLGSLCLVHKAGYVHGGIHPSNFIIIPETHQGILIDFTSAVKAGEMIKIANEYSPAEVTSKKVAWSKTDIYMAARLMKDLLGKTPVNKRIEGLLNACLINNGRLDDAYAIHQDFRQMLELIYGSPKFVEFKMP